MALPNQIDVSSIFSPRKINLKIGLIPEDDLPRMARSRKMTYREWQNPMQKMTYRDWPNPGLQQARISKEDLIKPAA